MDQRISDIIKDFADDVKAKLKDNLAGIYLFGSYGKETQNDLSDIDILIIVNHYEPAIRKEMGSLSSVYSINRNVIISPVIKELSIWEKNKKYDTLFYSNIEKYGIAL